MYPTELRVKAMTYCAEGLTNKEISEKLSVSAQSIGNWMRQLVETGTLSPKEPKYSPQYIGELLDKFKQAEAVKASESNSIKPADMSDIQTSHLFNQKTIQTDAAKVSGGNMVNPANALNCNS